MTDSFKVQFYILGFLIRTGPLHGYQLKARIESEARDFAKIKLANLYYHLGRMRAKGWVASRRGKEGNRPQKEVFAVTPGGEAAFGRLYGRCLEEPVAWDFAVDGALFFLDAADPGLLEAALSERRRRSEDSLARLARHREETLGGIPEPYRPLAGLIFAHHERHFETEAAWSRDALAALRTRRNAREGE